MLILAAVFGMGPNGQISALLQTPQGGEVCTAGCVPFEECWPDFDQSALAYGTRWGPRSETASFPEGWYEKYSALDGFQCPNKVLPNLPQQSVRRRSAVLLRH
jgi:hypothetical protein